MQGETLRTWRANERARLIAARLALDAGLLELWRQSIDTRIEQAFPQLSRATLAFCWPIRNEYDARPLVQRLRGRGMRAALPVIVAPGQPMLFREWYPGVQLAPGPLGILGPVGSAELAPDWMLLPMCGWDEDGYRLGYGGGYMDRTLGALPRKPRAIGVAYELARMPTIHPQPWDVPMDFIVTERALYRRANGRLVIETP